MVVCGLWYSALGSGGGFGRQGGDRLSDERCIAGTGAAVGGDEAGCAALGSGGGTGGGGGTVISEPCLGNGGGIGVGREHGVGFGREGVGAGCTTLLACSAATCGRGCVAVEALWLNESLDDEEACPTASSCSASGKQCVLAVETILVGFG